MFSRSLHLIITVKVFFGRVPSPSSQGTQEREDVFKVRTSHYKKYVILAAWGGAVLDLEHERNAATSCFFNEIMTVIH